MFRRRESVPFSFVAEADRFRSNVTPPPRPRSTVSERAGRVLVGLAVAAGLVGSLLLGLPAMGSGESPSHTQQTEAAHGR
ncbi:MULTISPECIES: hypothetical protein [unclassified Streptomyces]|uniref:hypothetical protein n=1 Tax=unclassified Streptomyces TaxID=2593676 RepID=UPI0008962E82|nr:MULTISPECIES: hypothetical protein [unclassified Streptomyces]WSX93660.1 hypothetical protein OH827_25375 [Streptomyces sp. NBC_00891]WSY08137.1 hypothetical protein OG464_25375 [Streptomyces sp. NBC_00890]WSZ09761.1 hypothetical protein OG704_25380 [Streptomyces sp. NBC_00869]WSZ22738.1 hypothetical protein OG498_08190 [Streptomyces sp. NBC_00870]NED11161.1 hypothetical protein [Streptomyces sp. SID9124]